MSQRADDGESRCPVSLVGTPSISSGNQRCPAVVNTSDMAATSQQLNRIAVLPGSDAGLPPQTITAVSNDYECFSNDG
jgi:hypothetical protein